MTRQRMEALLLWRSVWPFATLWGLLQGLAGLVALLVRLGG